MQPREDSLSVFLALPRLARLMVFGTFINNMGSFIGPFLALILVQKFHMEPARAGGVLSMFAFGTFASVLWGGLLTDELGRRRTLLLSLFGGGALAIALAFVASSGFFFPLLFFFGFVTDLYRPASSSLLGDLLRSEDRSTGFAALRVALNIGGALAMAAGGFLFVWNWRAMFVLDGLTTIAYGVVIYRNLPESKLQSTQERPGTLAGRAVMSVLGPWLDDPGFRLDMLGGLLLGVGFSTFQSALPLTVTRSAGYPEWVFGLLMSANGVLIFFFEIAVVRWLRRFRRLRVVAFGAGLIGLGLGMTGLVMHWAWFALCVLLWTAGEITTFSLMMSFHLDWAPTDRRGQYVALFQANWRISSALGAALLLPVYGALPVWEFWLIVPALTAASAVIFLHLDRHYDRPELLRGAAFA